MTVIPLSAAAWLRSLGGSTSGLTVARRGAFVHVAESQTVRNQKAGPLAKAARLSASRTSSSTASGPAFCFPLPESETRMYAKVFRSLWEGTLAGTGETWAVFVFLLAHCDPEGFVDMHPRVISSLTGFAEDRVRAALRELEAADHESRTPGEGGARIARLDSHRDWGWQVVNYQHYRTLTDAETVRAQNRERKRKQRDRSRCVTDGHASSRQVEVEAEGEERNTPSPDGSGASAFSENSENRSGSTNEPSPDFHLTQTHETQPRAKDGIPARNGDATRSQKSPEQRQNDKDWNESFAVHFWPEYRQWRPDGKAEAYEEWKKVTPKTEEHFHSVMAGLECQIAEWKAEQTDKRYRLHACRWIKRRRWQDFEAHTNGSAPVA